VNISTLNKDNGWKTQVSVNGTESGNRTIIYQPCGYIHCPSFPNCSGDNNANLWVCQSAESGSFCVAYGLFSRPVEVYLYAEGLGITIEVHGDEQLVGRINILCNESLDLNVLNFDSFATLDDRMITLFARSKNFCPNVPTPTPHPTFIPTIPTPLPTYTPNPFIEPIVYHSNETHYILFDLRGASNEYHQHNTQLVNADKKIPFFFNFSYWNLTQSPSEYENPFNIDLANIWGCWEVQGKPSCYSLGDKRVHVSGNGDDTRNLENGIIITYHGKNEVDAQIQVYCSTLVPTDMIDFSNKEVIYHSNSNRIIFAFEGLARFACPRTYQEPAPVPGTQTPTPDPPYSPQFYIESPDINGKMVFFDLNFIDFTYSQYVELYHSNYSERPYIMFSPVTKVPCPSGYVCQLSDTANIWKCFDGSKSCWPFGDWKYGFNLSIHDIGNATYPNVIAAHYQGGAYGYSTLIRFVCNSSLGYDQIRFRNSFEQNATVNLMIILAQVNSACPQDDANGFTIGSGSIGGIVLSIIFFGFLFYGSLGVIINFMTNGTVSFPNREFWSKVIDSVVAGTNLIFTCGNRASFNSQYHHI
jgi:hypothetical protein